ncbi:MAG: hypothetical protein ACMXX9_03590 [Candidatus Woesearchaeota archaeon]
MKAKKTAVGIIIGGVLVKGLKNLVFGNPPSKVRKTIIYSALAGTLIYNSCQPQLNSAKNYLDLSIDKYIETVQLKKDNESNALRVSLDSLYNINKSLDSQINNLVLKNGELIAKARESERKYQDKAKKVLDLKSNQSNNNFANESVRYNNNDLVNIQNNNYSSPNRSVINRANINSEYYWYVAKRFDSSIRIARNFTHHESYAQKILDFNGISEQDIIKGYPIIIPQEFLKFEHSSLRKDYVPRNIAIRKNETLDEFVIRVKNPPTITQRRKLVNEIKRYNNSKGNIMDYNGRTSKSLVYLPNGW